MPRIEFANMPAHARLWVFAANRDLNDVESNRLLSAVDTFLDGWRAHSVPLTAARDFRHRRFLFVSVDEKAAGVSGCSIDALVRGLRQLEGELEVTLVDNSPVLYRDGEEIRRVSRGEFEQLAGSGAVSGGTVVFNNTVSTVAELRAGRWEVPAAESWHAALL